MYPLQSTCRINVRFVALAGVTIALLGAGARYWHDRQTQRLADNLLRQSAQLEAQEQYSESAATLERYLKFAPGDMNSQAHVGRIWMRVPGGQEAALVAFETALRGDPDRQELRRELARTLVSLERFGEARQQLDRLREQQPHDPELAALLARCQAGAGDSVQAAQTLQIALASTPEHLELYELLSSLPVEPPRTLAAAIEPLDVMTAAHPRSADAYLVRSAVRRRGGDLVAARQDMDRALECAPHDVATLLAAAAQAQAEDDPHRAREHLQLAAELAPQNSAVCLARIQLELQAADPQAALAEADRAIAFLPSHPEILWAKADALTQVGDDARATAIIDQLQRAAYPSARLCYLEVQVLLGRHEWLAAAERFALARQAIGLGPELARRCDRSIAQCYMILGNLELALDTYRQLVERNPDWPEARLSLAAALESAGRHDEAIDIYRQLARRRSSPFDAAQTLARLLILRNLSRPENQREWNEVATILNAVPENPPAGVGWAILKAEADLAQGHVEAAAESLAAARRAHPPDAAAWAASVDLSLRQGDWSKAEELLADAGQACGDQADLRRARARLLVAQNGPGAKTLLIALEKTGAEGTAAEHRQLLAELAELHQSIGNLSDAWRLASFVAASEPQNTAIRWLLLDAARGSETPAALDKVLRQLGAPDAANPTMLGRYAEALGLLIRSDSMQPGTFASAWRLLGESQSRWPACWRFPRIEAEFDVREGNSAAALQHLRRAIELGDHSAGTLRQAVQLSMRESRFTQADQLLNDFDDRGLPFTAALARQAAEMSQSVINNLRLADLVRQAETEARTSDDCVWLGQLLTRLHRDAQAEKALRRAIDREPANEDAWVALARCTRLDGRTLPVDALVAEAGQRVPPARRALTAARCYEAAELTDKAQRQYELACQSTTPDPAALAETTAFYLRSGQTARATPMLRRLLKIPDLDSGRSAWARRKLREIWRLPAIMTVAVRRSS